MNKIYYNATGNKWLFTNIHGHDAVHIRDKQVTQEQYQEYRALELQGYTREAGADGLPVYTAPVQVIDKVKTAKHLLHKTHHFETNTHKDLLFTGEEFLIFEDWRRELLGVIIDGNELPETPPFITDLMERH